MKAILSVAALLLTHFASAAGAASLDAAVAAALGEPDVKFRSARVDLDGDSVPDAIVLLEGSAWCGSGGCNLLVFRGTETGFTLISKSTITAAPIRLLPSSHFCWRDLIVHSNGTGDVILQFDGTTYPANPSLAPTSSPKQLQSAREILGYAPNSAFKPNSFRSTNSVAGAACHAVCSATQVGLT